MKSTISRFFSTSLNFHICNFFSWNYFDANEKYNFTNFFWLIDFTIFFFYVLDFWSRISFGIKYFVQSISWILTSTIFLTHFCSSRTRTSPRPSSTIRHHIFQSSRRRTQPRWRRNRRPQKDPFRHSRSGRGTSARLECGGFNR